MEQVIEVELRGISPLLMHRFPEENGDPRTRRRTGSPKWEDEFESAKYQLEDGTLYAPATHVKGAMTRSAANFQIPGRRKKTFKDLVKSALIVEPEKIPHRIQACDIDKRPVVNPSTRGRVMRYRPRLDKWELLFTVRVLDEQLAPEVVREILEHAGRYVGIGDFRPEFGRFSVVRFREMTP